MYTKQQRREIYLKALKAFTEKYDTGFMCHELSRAIDPEAGFVSHDELLVLFPEWANCRPIGFVYHDSHSNVWEDEDTNGSAATNEEHNALRETILCLSLVQ